MSSQAVWSAAGPWARCACLHDLPRQDCRLLLSFHLVSAKQSESQSSILQMSLLSRDTQEREASEQGAACDPGLGSGGKAQEMASALGNAAGPACRQVAGGRAAAPC